MSAVYPVAKQAFLKSDAADLDGTVKIQAVSSGYTYSASHDFLNDVTSTSRIGTAVTLSNKTFTNGVFYNTVSVTYNPASTKTIKGFVGFIATTAEATSRLIWHCDKNADATSISLLATTSFTVSWPLGSIFSL
jgi:hypothetical protein